MSDRHDRRRTPSPDEQLSAYLAGELDDAQAAVVEDVLGRDPGAVARLRALETALFELGGLGDVEPPVGYDARLRRRLSDARRAPAVRRPPSVGRAGRAERTLRSDARPARWATVATVAAALVVGALVSAAVLRGLDVAGGGAELGGRATEVREDRRPGGAGSGEAGIPEMGTRGEVRAQDEAGAEGDRWPLPSAGERVPSPAAPQLADSPILRATGARLSGTAALRARYGDLPAATSLLGRSRVETLATADAFRDRVTGAPPFPRGVRPGACLQTALAAAEGPPVVVLVESVVYRGRDALAYVVVGAGDGVERLDRVVARVVDPEGCRMLADVVLA